MSNKKRILIFIISFILIIMLLTITTLSSKEKNLKTLEATILTQNKTAITIQDKNNLIYTLDLKCNNAIPNDKIILEYTGLLDKNNEIQDIDITNCKIIDVMNETTTLPDSFKDNGMFEKYYNLAYKKVSQLTLEDKIAQTLLIHYPNTDATAKNIIEKYTIGGFVYYEKDFQNKTKEQVKNMINQLQQTSTIPLLTAVDEEGGKVVRISSNPLLREDPFLSPSELFIEGGLELIHDDTIRKSKFLNDLGINLNLAPVVDVATDPNAYIYDRTLKEDYQKTAEYAKTVINASLNTGVSYTLKHFPGYGNNSDTHLGSSIDNRTYEDIIVDDTYPFKLGIEAGAEAVLVSHNIISNIDDTKPASLSPKIHNILRNELKFTGIIITDDINMKAIDNINNSNISSTNNINSPAVLALLAGNDLIITSDYQTAINNIKEAVNNNTISTTLIDKASTHIIAWKYYKGLMYENQK